VIRDLLWGCVVCGQLESLRMTDRIECCIKCGARYRRAKGASIAVEVEGKGIETRSAAEWTSQLPPITATGTSECLLRAAESDTKVRDGEYLGRVERFGNFQFGQLALTETSLSFEAREGGDSFAWALGELTAIQPSSTALQLKGRGRPLVSLKFVNSSPRLWEQRLQAALRQHYRGREIIEFQPRLTLR
jgi:hypothetical protein